MTDAPAASPERRRRHLDARLLVGLALVAASIAAVVGIVTAADEGEEVLAAPRLLTAGQLLTLDDLEVRRVALGLEQHGYLTAADVPAEGLVVTRTVGSGELVPRAAVGDARGPSATTVVVTLSTALGATVRPGDALDLWSAPALDAGRFGAPAVIASGTQLVRTVTADGIVTGTEAGRVELLVPRRDVARILHALANGDALSAIPTSLAIGG
ncbi:hypothetical protein [Microcella sp.]|uniref:hypothetical protein n=1 Tax=Microcella sp. TaxID=1913979 RepID=UPI003F72D468